MNYFMTIGLILAAIAALIGFTEFLINLSSDQILRRRYRRLIHPENIEKSAHDVLELEIQDLLDEELAKEKKRNKMEHPSNYKTSAIDPDLDSRTKDIISKMTNPKEAGRRATEGKYSKENKIFPNYPEKDKKDKYW